MEHLTTKIKSPDGTASVELTRLASVNLARLAKGGKFNTSDHGFSPEQLIAVSASMVSILNALTERNKDLKK